MHIQKTTRRNPSLKIRDRSAGHSTILFRKGFLFSLCLLLSNCILTAQTQYGQTRLYKRILIVQNGQKRSTNDDAHFITFNQKGFYISDSKGNVTEGNIVPFIKHDGNLHCYAGNIGGVYCKVFFSQDYSRINITNNNGDVTFVYQREPGKTTNAKMRTQTTSSGMSPVPLQNFNSYPSPSKQRNVKRTCPDCNGTGRHGDEITYVPDVTGHQPSVYCPKCGRTSSPHSHRQKMCARCYGRGTI